GGTGRQLARSSSCLGPLQLTTRRLLRPAGTGGCLAASTCAGSTSGATLTIELFLRVLAAALRAIWSSRSCASAWSRSSLFVTRPTRRSFQNDNRVLDRESTPLHSSH